MTYFRDTLLYNTTKGTTVAHCLLPSKRLMNESHHYHWLCVQGLRIQSHFLPPSPCVEIEESKEGTREEKGK